MKRTLPIGLLALFASALLAPAAGAATQLRQVQVPISSSAQTPPTASGTLTLRFVFKNTRQHRHKFTPRQLILIDFSKVPLLCSNGSGTGTSQLLLTETMDVKVKLKKAPPPHGKKPKPGRYAFRFSYSFPAFTGTLTGTIDKPNPPAKPRPTRSQGTLTIDDLDANPGHMNCSTTGRRSWGGLPVTGI